MIISSQKGGIVITTVDEIGEVSEFIAPEGEGDSSERDSDVAPLRAILLNPQQLSQNSFNFWLPNSPITQASASNLPYSNLITKGKILTHDYVLSNKLYHMISFNQKRFNSDQMRYILNK